MVIKTKHKSTATAVTIPELADVSSIYSSNSTEARNIKTDHNRNSVSSHKYTLATNRHNTKDSGNNSNNNQGETSPQVTTFINLLTDSHNTTTENWTNHTDLPQWKTDIFSESMVYYHENAKPWGGPVILCIFKDKSKGSVNVVSIDKFGTSLTENIDITPESQYYPAIEALGVLDRNSNVKRCIAVTFLRRFVELSDEGKSHMCKVAGLKNLDFYDPVYAGELASGCKLMTSVIPVTLCGLLYSWGFLQTRVLQSSLLDIVYENKEEVMQLNNKLVSYLGEQLEQLFNPVTEYSPEQTEYTYKPPANNLPKTDMDNASVKAICDELLEVQSKFTYSLVEFLQKFLIVVRVQVMNGNGIEGLSTSKLNRLFPPTIDEVTRINCIFLDSLRVAAEYGSLEILKACSITIPYFYKAYTRHEAATKNFSKDIKLFLKNFKDIIPQADYYTETKLESIIKGPQEKLLELKQIIERLYRKKRWSSQEIKEVARANYTNIIEVIDSFANLNKPLSSYSTRVFTPSVKILTELAKGWPVELQYKWLKRRVVGVFDVVNVMSVRGRSLLVIFSDYVVILNIVDSEKYYSKKRPHKPLISNILMNSLINEVPLPAKIPKLEVQNFAHINDVLVSICGGTLLRIDSLSSEGERSFSATFHVVSNKKSSVHDIAELITKARVLEKDTAFHLFRYTERNFTVYSTAHEIQSYEREGIKSRFAVFLNIEPSEYLLTTHNLHLAVFAKFGQDTDGECDTIQLDYLTYNDPRTLFTVKCGSDKLMATLLGLLSRELPVCYSSIYSQLAGNLLAINEAIITKLLDVDNNDWSEGTQLSLLEASVPPALEIQENRKSYGTITTFRSNVSDLRDIPNDSTQDKKQKLVDEGEDKWKSIAIESRAELRKKIVKVEKDDKAKKKSKRSSGVLTMSNGKTGTVLEERVGVQTRKKKKSHFLGKILVFFSRDKKKDTKPTRKTQERNIKIVHQTRKEPEKAIKVPVRKVKATERTDTVRYTSIAGKPISTLNVESPPIRSTNNEVKANASNDETIQEVGVAPNTEVPTGTHQIIGVPTSMEEGEKHLSHVSLPSRETKPLVGSDIEQQQRGASPLGTSSSSPSPPPSAPTDTKDKAQSSPAAPSGSATEEDKLTPQNSPIKSSGEQIMSPQGSKASKDEEVIGLGLSKVSTDGSNNVSEMESKATAKNVERIESNLHDTTNIKLAHPLEHQSELFNDDLFGDFVPNEILNPKELQVENKSIHGFGEIILPVTSTVQPSNGSKDLTSPKSDEDVDSESEDGEDAREAPISKKGKHHIFPQIPRVPTTAFTITFDKSPSFNELYRKMRVVLDETDATYNWIRIPTEVSLSQQYAVNTNKLSTPENVSTGNTVDPMDEEAGVSETSDKFVERMGTVERGVLVRRINASPGKHASNNPHSLPLEFLNNRINASPPPRSRPRSSYNEGLKALLKADIPNLRKTSGSAAEMNQEKDSENLAYETVDPMKKRGVWLAQMDNDTSVMPETSLMKEVQLAFDEAFSFTDKPSASNSNMMASESLEDSGSLPAVGIYKNLSARTSSDSKDPPSRTPSEEEYCTPFENPSDTATDAEDSLMERSANRYESSQDSSAKTVESPGHSSDVIIISETKLGEPPHDNVHEVQNAVEHDDYVAQMLDELDFSSFHLDFDAPAVNDVAAQLPGDAGDFRVGKNSSSISPIKSHHSNQGNVDKSGVVIYRFPGKPLSSASVRLESRRRGSNWNEDDPIWVSPTKLEFYDLTRIPNTISKSTARQATVVKRPPQPKKVNNSNLPKDLSYAFLADYIKVREDADEAADNSNQGGTQRQSNYLQFV